MMYWKWEVSIWLLWNVYCVEEWCERMLVRQVELLGNHSLHTGRVLIQVQVPFINRHSLSQSPAGTYYSLMQLHNHILQLADLCQDCSHVSLSAIFTHIRVWVEFPYFSADPVKPNCTLNISGNQVMLLLSRIWHLHFQ